MDEAIELAEYLPLSFRAPNEEEYIAFLWDAFETNYTHGKYQFAFLAYHMLTISFVYFRLWQIKQARPGDFEKGLIGFARDETTFLSASSPFVFSSVNERTILRFLKLIACDSGRIRTYAKLVDDRNNAAHSNGHVFFNTQDALDRKVAEILRVVHEIQVLSRSAVEQCYQSFLLQSSDPDGREYSDVGDQVREVLINGSYFSYKDVETCLAFDLARLGDHPEMHRIRELHEVLRSQYGSND
jgi:hypothetical protein